MKEKVLKKQSKVSMQDVANAAGVSRSTVSFVLNDLAKVRRISADVSLRVKEAAEKMNYQVDQVARSLRTGQSRIIALLVADISDYFFATVAYHCQEYAESRGYTLFIINTGEKQYRLREIFNLLKTRKVDGIIMVPIANIEEGVIEKLNPGIPMVYIDRYFDTLHTGRVRINNYEVSTMATQLLIGKGCRRTGLITYNESLRHMKDRNNGYLDTIRKSDLFDDSLLCAVEYINYRNTISDFLAKKMRSATPLEGIFITTGGLSQVVIRCLVNMDVKIQSDIQVIGFDRMDAAVGVSVPYVKQPVKDLCEKALNILIESIILHSDGSMTDYVLPASIVTDSFFSPFN
ncbi:MAG: LacI family transcriptional regulator [Tannerella sp.]|jgi:LacI family transcriptional regulator|nr:LacI family transcriptional regulator [Tannerella sp.]